MRVSILAVALLSFTVNAFAPSSLATSRKRWNPLGGMPFHPVQSNKRQVLDVVKLRMAFDDDGSPGLMVAVGGTLLVVLFLATTLVPMFEMTQGGRDANDLSLADSVVTRQDAPDKLRGYEGKFDSLSRSTIQEKLSTIPVFYLTDGDGGLKPDIYLSVADAKEASSGASVKATTLDQVTYPLVLKRGGMRMEPPLTEVEHAESMLNTAGSQPSSYQLVPSSASQKAAKSLNLDLAAGDVPLFIADKLAFAGPKGPQVPLFLEKSDCITSYNRLRESRPNLPAEPTIRISTLIDELNSMEKGSRPGLSQLSFYASEADLLAASDLSR